MAVSIFFIICGLGILMLLIRKHVITATIFTIIIGIPGYFHYSSVMFVNSLSPIVQFVSENDKGTAYCPSFFSTFTQPVLEGGHVMSNEPNIAVINFEQCQDLKSYADSDKKNPSLEQVTAVHILTHESVHVGGNYDEASTECEAMTLDAEVAKYLGATQSQAEELANRYRTEVYPHLSSEYQGQC